jgi:hypothetical protein
MDKLSYSSVNFYFAATISPPSAGVTDTIEARCTSTRKLSGGIRKWI